MSPRDADVSAVSADEPVVIRDKRRVDPTSGQVRADVPSAPGPGPTGVPQSTAMAPETVALQDQLAERTADLQRLKAEFDNYRRRVDRDRALIAEQATAKVLSSLLGVLDDIGRARQHGDLSGPFRVVAETLETALTGLGLETYGEPGEEFDPARHEALLHSYRDDVSSPTCVDVMRAGYLFSGRVLRPAQVAVAEPESTPDSTAPAGVPTGTDGPAAEGSAPA